MIVTLRVQNISWKIFEAHKIYTDFIVFKHIISNEYA